MANRRLQKKRTKDLIKSMRKKRGYPIPPWEYVAEKDVNFMEAYDKLYTLALMRGKVLPVKTKELIVISLFAFRGNEGGAYNHMKRALKHGATKQEILEALKTSIIPGGAPTFTVGLRALMRIEQEEQKVR
jgi:alkylhydroperoxidase/carboxymuconolactone decarboxylase family protein YurZ